MDQDRRTRLPAPGNQIIRPGAPLESDRDDGSKRARHLVRVSVDSANTSVGYRYNDDFEFGITINTNVLIGLFK